MNQNKKITTIETDQNQILSKINKLNLKDGDILLFNVKTDENGIPLVDLDVVSETANMLSEILSERNVTGLFLLDKICLFSVENSKQAIKRLEEVISYIQEAIDKVRDIENRNSEESFLVIDINKK